MKREREDGAPGLIERGGDFFAILNFHKENRKKKGDRRGEGR